MALAWIQFHDQRRPPPIDVELQIGITAPQSDDDAYVRGGSNSDEDIDEDKPLYTPLEKDSLSRHGSVGNSWGVTAVGRGFDWTWKKKEMRDDDDDGVQKAMDIPTITQEDKDIAADVQDDATPTLSSSDPAAISHAIGLVERDPNPAESLNLSFEGQSAGNRIIPSPTNSVSQHESLSMPQQSSPFTPSLSPSPGSAHLPLSAMQDEPISPHSPRPFVAVRSQSMYVVPTAGAEDYGPSHSPLARSANASPQIQAQRAKAWSRPVSPTRSPSLPRLATSPSAPSLNGFHAFTPMTPLVVTCGALTTPTTPRSPRLNRSRYAAVFLVPT